MALPKEPRQKMINIMYLVLTAILALNVSAEILESFKTVDKSLQASNSNLNTSTNLLYKSLQEKLAEGTTMEQAKIWQPRAEEAHKYADRNQ
jgi:Skp family chaperone for outer membrane proteins